ncbi:site-specific integrase [Sanyastnella coralliicola]|uniref:site-specific integrase n=1 Tax=Sanyastnella coralliicola TaxID=3069118 RepID=UPI0027B99B9B|nr:site-specific integrase [Longitalea sp. SCSIO 12813]
MALEEGLHSNMIFKSKSFKKPHETSDSVYLGEDEIQRITEVNLNEKLNNVRDLFLLGCHTGLRFSDYDKLKPQYMVNDGNLLRLRTQKTGEEIIIPLHPRAKAIIEKHNKNGGIQPISNQKFNEYVKVVCQKAGIDQMTTISRTIAGRKQDFVNPKYELISSHTGRRSFATNAYLAGVPSLAIMSITGHRTESSFLKYIKVSKEEQAKVISNHSFFSP